MRRALRHLFTILSALSLLLCVAVCVLWVRGRFVSDTFKFVQHREDAPRTVIENGHEIEVKGDSAERIWTVASSLGGIGIGMELSINIVDENSAGFHWRREQPAAFLSPPQATLARRLGFDVAVLAQQLGPRQLVYTKGVILPTWFVLVVSAFLPAVLVLRQRCWRTARRLSRGQCVHCGYDLRASPERCPECGTANPPAV
jgi:hypothetical protein